VTRDHKLVAIFAVLALSAGGVVGAHVVSAGPRVNTVERMVPLQSADTLSVVFLGDTMLADGAQDQIDAHGYGWPLQQVAPVLDADFAIANAESPISANTRVSDPLKQYSYVTGPPAAAALAAAGVDALGLANNHVMDVGLPGLKDTVKNSHAAHLATFGAGTGLKPAARPLLLRSPAGTLAVVGIGEDFGNRSTAAVGHAGTLALSPETVQRGVDVARAAGADWVVAYVHWGDNYQPVVAQQRAWAVEFAKAGYDMVIGTGPHVVQPITLVRGMPVAYSIGNFVFGSPGRFESYGTKGYGLALRLDLSSTHKARISATCLATDNSKVDYQPRPCTDTQAADLFPTVSPRLTPVSAGRATFRCGCLAARTGR
jgi:hypothetical protein